MRKLSREPGTREPPVAHHRLLRDVQHLTGFFDAQSAKEAELNHLSSSRIDPLERSEGVVQRADLRADRRTMARQIIEIDRRRMLRPDHLSAPFD